MVVGVQKICEIPIGRNSDTVCAERMYITFKRRYSLLLDLSGAKLGEAMAQTTADRLRSIHLSVRTDGDVLNTTGIYVAGDISSKQINLGR